MNYVKLLFLAIALPILVGLSACSRGGNAGPADSESSADIQYERIVSLSGAITETLFALGEGSRLVGIDVTSTYPADSLFGIAQLGHVRQLNAEAVLGLRPDLIIADTSIQHNKVWASLAGAGIEILLVAADHSLDSPIRVAEQIAEKMGTESGITEWKKRYEQERTELEALVARSTYEPKVLFIYARGAGNMMVAGRETPAEAMIGLAGGRNAIEEFSGFKALTAEGLIEAQPDVLLLFDSGFASIGNETGLYQLPGINHTPAGRHQRVVTMDGLYLLGFTPRAAQAALDLAEQLQAFDYQQNL